MKIELIGTLLFYAHVESAQQIKAALIRIEGAGNVVIGITPTYEDGNLQAVFISVAGAAHELPVDATPEHRV